MLYGHDNVFTHECLIDCCGKQHHIISKTEYSHKTCFAPSQSWFRGLMSMYQLGPPRIRLIPPFSIVAWMVAMFCALQTVDMVSLYQIFVVGQKLI
jgi:hypothetical protein